MAKWIYVDTDDQAIGQAVMTALETMGYTAKEILPSAPVAADIHIQCTRQEESRRLHMGRLTVDLDNDSASTDDGMDIHFTPIEFSMLCYLMHNRHRAVSRDELLPAVWGFENDSGTRVADDTVKRLRRKLNETDLRIETVWGYGFKLVEQ